MTITPTPAVPAGGPVRAGRDRQIIFSGPMVRALLDGRMTQTRRVLKRLSHFGAVTEFGPSDTTGYDWHFRDKGMRWHDLRDARLRECLPYAVGDRLWVRENHQFRGASYNDGTARRPNWSEEEWFRCWGGDGPGDSWDPDFPAGWWPSMHMGVHRLTGPGHNEGPEVRGYATKRLPSIHMPRWASRLTLIVTDVRVERLNDISEADAWAEGCQKGEADDAGGFFPAEEPDPSGIGLRGWDNARDWFADLWEEINGDDAWEANPWVVSVTFTVHRANIDALPTDPQAGTTEGARHE